MGRGRTRPLPVLRRKGRARGGQRTEYSPRRFAPPPSRRGASWARSARHLRGRASLWPRGPRPSAAWPTPSKRGRVKRGWGTTPCWTGRRQPKSTKINLKISRKIYVEFGPFGVGRAEGGGGGRIRDRLFLPGGAKRARAPPRCRRVSALRKNAEFWPNAEATLSLRIEGWHFAKRMLMRLSGRPRRGAGSELGAGGRHCGRGGRGRPLPGRLPSRGRGAERSEAVGELRAGWGGGNQNLQK